MPQDISVEPEKFYLNWLLVRKKRWPSKCLCSCCLMPHLIVIFCSVIQWKLLFGLWETAWSPLVMILDKNTQTVLHRSWCLLSLQVWGPLWNVIHGGDQTRTSWGLKIVTGLGRGQHDMTWRRSRRNLFVINQVCLWFFMTCLVTSLQYIAHLCLRINTKRGHVIILVFGHKQVWTMEKQDNVII